MYANYPVPERGVGFLGDDDAVDEGRGVVHLPAARRVDLTVALVYGDGGAAGGVVAGGGEVVDEGPLTGTAGHGPGVERVGRVVGAAVPVEEGLRGHLHFSGRHHPPHGGARTR